MNKKIIILMVVILVLGFLGVFLYISSFSGKNKTASAIDYSDALLHSSEWIDISKKDLTNLALGNYTAPVSKSISSLEKAVPVIVYVVNGRFDKEGKGNFIVLSAFNAEGKIYTYISQENSVEKNLYGIEDVFENAKKVLILSEPEVV